MDHFERGQIVGMLQKFYKTTWLQPGGEHQYCGALATPCFGIS